MSNVSLPSGASPPPDAPPLPDIEDFGRRGGGLLILPLIIFVAIVASGVLAIVLLRGNSDDSLLTATAGDAEVELSWTVPDEGGDITDYMVQYRVADKWGDAVEALAPVRHFPFTVTSPPHTEVVENETYAAGGEADLNVAGFAGSGIEFNGNGYAWMGDIGLPGEWRTSYAWFIRTEDASSPSRLTDLWGGGNLISPPGGFSAVPLTLFELNGNSADGILTDRIAFTFGTLDFDDVLNSPNAVNWQVDSPTVDWQDGEWHLFVVTADYTNNTSRCWIDGEEQTLEFLIEGDASPVNITNLTFGQGSNGDTTPQGSAEYFGVADEFLAFDRLLDDSEVEALTSVAFGDWETFAGGTSSSTGATVTGLTNGIAYEFRVAAVNSKGPGDWSNVAGPYTPTEVRGLMP